MAQRTTIRVTKAVRDHLAQVAKERGMTLGQFVGRLAAEQLTAEQRAERLRADRELVRSAARVDLSDDDIDRDLDVLGYVDRASASSGS